MEIIGASVMIKGTSTGASSRPDGSYSITVKSRKDILIFSYIGCITLEEVVGNRNEINVVLEANEQSLSEVVVTAYNTVRKRSMVSYTTTHVSSKKIADNNSVFKTWKRNGVLDENSVQLAVGDKDYLPLKSVQVAVQVDGFRARVLFDYFFYSDKPKQLRGTFKLKLPAGASPYYFAFGGTEYLNKDKEQPAIPFVSYPSVTPIDLGRDSIFSLRNNNWSAIKEAIVAPKEKAAYAFGEVVRGRADPALMEWAGADVFSCSLFPIQKDKLHRIVIGYDINLSEAGNDAVLTLLLPYKKIPKKLDIDIAGNDQLAHQIEPVITNKTVAGNRTKYHIEDFNEKIFTISAHTGAPVFLQNKNDEKYFALSFKPELPEIPVNRGSRDAVFLLDVSLSSQPDKFNVWLKTIEGILKNNRKQIRQFAVLCFNVDVFWWKESYSPNSEDAVNEFLEYADKLSLVGATDLGLALKEATMPKWLPKKPLSKTLFLLSDGDASWGEDNLYQLSGILSPTDKVFAFTTGFSGTDTRILDHLCRQTNGAVFSVLNEDEVDKVGNAIHYEPWRIKNISLDNGRDLLVAGRPYFVFAGQKLIVTGRGEITNQSIITLTVQQGTVEKTFSIPASQIIQSDLTNRIYGQVAVNQLEDFSFKTETASVQYAMHFGVAGQTCSWVMLESGNLYKRYGLKEESVKDFIDSHYVTHIIHDLLKEEEATRSLGNAKADFRAWVNKLEKDKIIDLKTDTLFNLHLAGLPESSFIVPVRPLNGKVFTSDEWYNNTLAALRQSMPDYDMFMKTIRAEKRYEGKADAFKLISSFVENNRADITLLRDIAFVLSDWDLDGKSYELSKRLVAARPAEPPSYNLIANSLVKMNRIDLALIYYDLAFLTYWDNRFDGFDLITAVEYFRLLKEIEQGKYKAADMAFVKARLEKVKSFLDNQNIDANDADLLIVITWNTDNTDVDLHVREPNKQECYFENKKTSNGGLLTNDATDGFGPEMYFIKKAPAGTYSLDIDYYNSSYVLTSAKSKILVTAYKNWGRPNEQRFRKIVELKSSERRNNRSSTGDEDEDKLLKNVLVMKF